MDRRQVIQHLTPGSPNVFPINCYLLSVEAVSIVRKVMEIQIIPTDILNLCTSSVSPVQQHQRWTLQHCSKVLQWITQL